MAILMKNQFLAAFLAVILVLQGCTSQVMGPKSQATPEARLSASEGKTVVFLRMKASIETKLFEEVPLMSGPDEKGFGISLKPQGGPATPVLVQLHRIDFAETGEKGWLYFSSDPGNYELKFVQNSRKGQKALLPSFILRVPPQKSAIYAGSVHFSCRAKAAFWSANLGECEDIKVWDEGKTAQNLAKPLFGESGQVFVSILGPISTSLMSKYEKPVAASQRPAIFPMGYVTGAGTKDLVSPEWVKRGIGRAAAPQTAELAAGLMGVPVLNYAGALIAAAYVAYLPVGLIAGAIAGKSAEKKWQPCLQELAQEIKENDPTAALQRKLGEELKKFHDSKTIALPPEGEAFKGSGPRELKSLLQVEVQRIQIRECSERGSFCVEVAIRARLWTIPGYSLYLDQVLVYTGSSLYERIPSEIQVPGSSPCRKMEAYCGPQGKQIFREEIAAAIPNLVERLLIEVGL